MTPALGAVGAALPSAAAAVRTEAPRLVARPALAPVDAGFSEGGEWRVLEGAGAVWTCKLKVGAAKHFILQLLHIASPDASEDRFCLWTRWGALGEAGKSQAQPCPSLEFATEAFKAKFYEKTNNQWEGRRSFKPFFGKFVLAEQPPALPEAVDAPAPSGGAARVEAAVSAEAIAAAHKLLDMSKANKWADVFKALDARPELVNMRPDVREFSVLHQAAYLGKGEIIAALVEKYRADPALVTKSGKSAAQVAQEQGFPQLAAAMR